MTIPTMTETETPATSAVSHPLDPLTPREIAEASSILKADKQLGPRVRFETVVLREPEKETALNFKPGDPIRRDAFLVVLDNDGPATYEAVVSLDERSVVSWRHVPGVQPRVMFDEFLECEAAVQADPRFREAIKKRGITDPGLVMVDPWSAGNYGFADEEGRRLVLCRNFVRAGPTDNGYARPIEGVTAVVDLNNMAVVRVDDYGVVPLPPRAGNYSAEFVEKFRDDLKPLEITQPEGAELPGGRLGRNLAEVASARRIYPQGRAGNSHGRLRRPGPGPPGHLPGRVVRHGGALRRARQGSLPQERL